MCASLSQIDRLASAADFEHFVEPFGCEQFESDCSVQLIGIVNLASETGFTVWKTGGYLWRRSAAGERKREINCGAL